MTNKKTLEDALAEMAANIAKAAESQDRQLPELEAEIAKQNAFSLRLAALSQSQRRQVLDAAGMRHISAAPPPITPLNASGYSQPSKRTIQAPIDWRYWRHMPEVKQWEACALSLNIEPSSMKQSPNAWMSEPGGVPKFTPASFSSETVQTEFDKRLRLLGASLFKSGFFTTVNKLVVGGRHLATISLEQFARWGLHVELEMPPELVAMAVTEPTAAPATDTATPAPVEAETTEQRRSRWLDWFGKGERGAVQRVYERELLLNPKADRSFIGKEIKVAETEQADKKRAGTWSSQLVQDGKRKD